LTVLVLDVISNAVSISGSILLFAPLIILEGGGYLSVLSPLPNGEVVRWFEDQSGTPLVPGGGSAGK
jgi:hypothetical protein